MAAPPTLQFLGASGTVTGSKYLVRHRGQQVLLDCGLFQGLKELRLRNWLKPEFSPREIASVVLSHAHIDHTGYLPLLVKRGFRGRVHCTAATADLIEILLPDSARLQEEDTARANREGYTKHRPAVPLYDLADVKDALKLIERHPFGKEFPVAGDMKATFRRTGHILGAASIDLAIGKPDPVRLVFSGDLGRFNDPILHDPEPVPEADVVLVESTYGDRVHPPDPIGELERIINESVQRGGPLIIPAFAVGRTQELLWHIRQLETENRIPVLPVYIDSPMATEVTDLYCHHTGEHNLSLKELTGSHGCGIQTSRQVMVHTVDESKAINGLDGPFIVIAGSGMATGGRVLHHLARRLSDPRTTVLLPGFQAQGTRGRQLEEGARTVHIHGRDVEVNAQVYRLEGLSAHGDRNEILRWLHGFQRPPAQCYIVHGEPVAAQALTKAIEEELDWPVRPAVDQEVVTVLKNAEWPA
ncbi:MAG TPA: MBL fold metallo-hydrolase [Gemmataceae bacterium]|nr:MBL fold metallo-hydrolase [Gemmataceae bacterium]